MAFKQQVIWITGGGSGLGAALAAELAARGGRVIISGRRLDRLRHTCDLITNAGGDCTALVCDVVDDEAVAATVRTIVADFGQLDLCVANAGMAVVGPFERLSAAEWEQQFGVNVQGAANTARHAVPELKKRAGRMVFIGSVAGLVFLPNSAAYGASKAAIRAMSLTLSLELKGSGASSTVIHPGFVESDISKVDNLGVYQPDRQDKRPKAVMWKADRAARVMARAIAARKREFVFTGHGRIGAFLGMHFPGVVHVIGGLVAGKAANKLAENKGATPAAE